MIDNKVHRLYLLQRKKLKNLIMW